jgi:ferredoxin
MEDAMTHVITSLCLHEGSCALVCPVECIVPGKPESKWPWYYIDADTCIDCGACIPECPYSAIFPDSEVPTAYKAKGGEYMNMPVGTPGFTTPFDGVTHDGDPVHLDATRILKAGEVIDFTPAFEANNKFFKDGPGYGA